MSALTVHPALAGVGTACNVESTLRRIEPGDPVEPVRASLAEGGVIAFPTESSYGLGADPRSPVGVEAVFRVKGRPSGKALPVVVANHDQALALGVEMSDPGFQAVSELWPAPLTVVVPLRGSRVGLAAAAGGDSLAVRIPDHPDLLWLLEQLGHGLTATSANRSGEPPITHARGLESLLEGVDAWWLNGGELSGGSASTVVSWDSASGALEVLRAGRYELR